MYYPNGNSDYLQGQILKVIKVRTHASSPTPSQQLADAVTCVDLQHWYRMRGLTPPDSMPAVACPQPELTA